MHDVLGGMVRNYCECYNTAGSIPGVQPGMSIKERARAHHCRRLSRIPNGRHRYSRRTARYNTRERVHQLLRRLPEAREGVGKDGDWCIDFHQRFDLGDAIRACEMIKDTAPFSSRTRCATEAFLQDLPILRQKVNVPLAAGEEWGNRWDFNKLVENHDIDFMRATLPNVGGITEMLKIAAICETHFVGIVPHFTGPISTAALVHVLGTYPGAGADGIQLRGRTIPTCRSGSTSRMGSSIPTSARAWR